MQVAAKLEIPEKHFLLASDRTHNAIIRRLVQWEMYRHGSKVLPRHFEPPASQRYNYLPRTPKYIRYKLRRVGHNTDLILSGRSQREILGNQKITVGGSASGSRAVSATLRTRFAWADKSAASVRKRYRLRREALERGEELPEHLGGRPRLRASQLVLEVQRFTDEEVKEINANLLSGYMATLRAMPSIRRRIDQRLLF